jgi:hypothetical protein
VSIGTFSDQSGSGPATLGPTFTNKARQYFQNNSTLTLVPRSGDLQLEGNVVSYSLSPQAPTGNDIAARTRLTITIQVKYTNTKKPEEDFDQQLSSFADFGQNQNITPALEQTLIETISNQILLDLFQKTVANW